VGLTILPIPKPEKASGNWGFFFVLNLVILGNELIDQDSQTANSPSR
jgi:hypothetical protein